MDIERRSLDNKGIHYQRQCRTIDWHSSVHWFGLYTFKDGNVGNNVNVSFDIAMQQYTYHDRTKNPHIIRPPTIQKDVALSSSAKIINLAIELAKRLRNGLV